MSSSSEAFDQPSIMGALKTAWLGQDTRFLPVVTSTNDVLKKLAYKGASAGTIVVADYQSQGRGRLDRRWDCPAGTSLLLSVLFRPQWPLDRINWLTMIAGLAAAEAITDLTGLATCLKWPNDVLVCEGQRDKKVAGLLLESEIENGMPRHVILGTGINVNVPSDELPFSETTPTSLLASLGRPVSRLALINGYLTKLEHYYERCEQGISPRLAWMKLLSTIGQNVRISGAGLTQPVKGLAESVDELGNLIVRDDQHQPHVIVAGDVTLRV